MSGKKAYPLRINTEVLAAMQRWSDDELRSVNAQIEYVLRDALRRTGRLRGGEAAPAPAPQGESGTRGRGKGKGDDGTDAVDDTGND